MKTNDSVEIAKTQRALIALLEGGPAGTLAPTRRRSAFSPAKTLSEIYSREEDRKKLLEELSTSFGIRISRFEDIGGYTIPKFVQTFTQYLPKSKATER